MTNFMEKEETMYHTIEVNVLKILGNNIWIMFKICHILILMPNFFSCPYPILSVVSGSQAFSTSIFSFFRYNFQNAILNLRVKAIHMVKTNQRGKKTTHWKLKFGWRTRHLCYSAESRTKTTMNMISYHPKFKKEQQYIKKRHVK